MKVELVAFTGGQDGTEFENRSIDEIIVGMARVSSSREINELFTNPHQLLRHCLLEQHWSIFDECNLTFKIETSRAMGRELLRHQLKPQEFCLSGDSLITFIMPSGQEAKKSISDLYNLSILDKKLHYAITNHSKKRILNCNIKTFDLETKAFTKSKIKNIFNNGKKHLYEITLLNGKKIKTTLEHKFLNKNYSFEDIKNICNVIIDIDYEVISFDTERVAVNGIELYKDKDVLLSLKNESIENKKGLQYIADKCNISTHCIKKWLKKYNISYTKKEVASMYPVWNKGKNGYKLKPRSLESRQKMSEQTPKGKFHHAYRGGGRNERSLIQTYISMKKHLIYEKYGEKCTKCNSNTNLQLHHIEEVTRNPYKAYDLNNIIPLCNICHKKTHELLSKIPYEKIYDLDNFDWKSVRPAEWKDNPFSFYGKKKTLKVKRPGKHTVYFDQVKNIKYIGVEETYDLEVENLNHNYVANGIVVHNSQRYAPVIQLENVELRKQSKNNRQSSTDIIKSKELNALVDDHNTETLKLYNLLLENGVARECARFILPETATTVLYLNGTVRVWLSVLNQRLHKTAQKEIRLIAEEIRDILIEKCPIISGMMFNFEDAYDIHVFERIVLEKYGLYNMIKENDFKKVK
jgi:thymidylate synthase ThyX